MSKNNIIIQAKSDPTTKLWFIDQNQNNINNKIVTDCNNSDIIEINSIQITGPKKQSILYYHLEFFSPVQSTWIQAINKCFFDT